jgi:hypothetical protein
LDDTYDPSSDPGYDPYADDPGATTDDTGDAADVTDGSELPDTGIGPLSRPDGGMVLLLGMAGFLVLGGAYRFRRSPNR